LSATNADDAEGRALDTDEKIGGDIGDVKVSTPSGVIRSGLRAVAALNGTRATGVAATTAAATTTTTTTSTGNGAGSSKSHESESRGEDGGEMHGFLFSL